MHTNDHFLLPRCTGMNCGATDANHSPECRAEHAAAIAGGRFVKDEKRAADADARAVVTRLAMLLEAGQAANGIAHERQEIYAEALRALLADGGKGKAVNQCDGCRVGAPLSGMGNHVMPDGGFMGCTKDRYTAPQAECAPREAQPFIDIDADCANIVDEHFWELTAAPIPATDLSDAFIAEMAYKQFGIVAQDDEVVSFARAILAADKGKKS
jgi:hypothetical protein